MKILRITTSFALILAFIVVTLGAYTRLTNAGLGCPDWPGCYGKLILTNTAPSLKMAQKTYPKIPIEYNKAWTEMVHRYAAGTLALLIFFIFFKTIINYKKASPITIKISLTLVLLVIFQALLGMWTVTFKLLPIVVCSHLLGGILIFCSLGYLRLNLSNIKNQHLPKLKSFITLGLIIILTQILLGGLVSANYAGIACIGFPKCSGQWLPSLNFANAFNLFKTIGENYQGGLLDNESRATLQVVHRLGALITTLYLLCLNATILLANTTKITKILAIAITITIIAQFSLGVLNVLYLLPLSIALLHNACAAILLALMTSLRYIVSSGGNNANSI